MGWMRRLTAWQASGVALLDLRPRAAFRAGHLAGAAHICATQLPQRRHELPPAGAALCLLHDGDADHCVADLASWGYSIVDVWCADATLWQAARDTGCLRSGAAQTQLWSPCPLLSEFLAGDHAPRAGRALDVACGAGRDALHLARQGWLVSAVDQSADALSRLQLSAREHDVPVRSWCMDLEQDDSQLPEPPYDLLLVARYLHRPLFAQLRTSVAPGGHLLYQTFMVGAERFGGPRRPAFLLQAGELAAAFAGFDILLDRVDHLPDGRPVNSFIARRPPAA